MARFPIIPGQTCCAFCQQLFADWLFLKQHFETKTNLGCVAMQNRRDVRARGFVFASGFSARNRSGLMYLIPNVRYLHDLTDGQVVIASTSPSPKAPPTTGVWCAPWLTRWVNLLPLTTMPHIHSLPITNLIALLAQDEVMREAVESLALLRYSTHEICEAMGVSIEKYELTSEV